MESCLLSCKLSYNIAITVASFINALVLTTNLISLSIGIGEVSGIARIKSLFLRVFLWKNLFSSFSMREN